LSLDWLSSGDSEILFQAYNKYAKKYDKTPITNVGYGIATYGYLALIEEIKALIEEIKELKMRRGG